MTTMVHRLNRFLLPLTCIAALTAAPALASAKPLVGISDNSAAMFGNSWFTRLNLPIARIMVDWNTAVMKNKSELHATQAWVAAALADKVQPMISFTGDTHTTSSYVPTTSQYTSAIQAFLKAVPQVKTYSPWNEPDWIYRPHLSNNPALAASYFNALIRYCHGCTIVAGDVYRQTSDGLGSWLKAYARHLGARPKAWALHNYYDVREHNTRQLQALYNAVHPRQIWLTEISGVERRGHWQFRNQSPNAANRDEQFLFSLPKRFHSITRIYHYQWQAVQSVGWDSGLLGPQGKPRPAYWTLANYVGPHKTRDHR
ncbi:MAG TPA: glycosyl hydrolase [Solirubrobacteraceae bacterium]|nr:glycosyl hydrolase [Solirubrobacteraceae bacterium]